MNIKENSNPVTSVADLAPQDIELLYEFFRDSVELRSFGTELLGGIPRSELLADKSFLLTCRINNVDPIAMLDYWEHPSS